MLLRGAQQLAQARLGAAEQCGLQKQVAAGVAGQAEFRQAQQPDARPAGVLHGGQNLGGVVFAVGHTQRRRGRAYRKKSVFHSKALLYISVLALPEHARRGPHLFLYLY